MSGWMYRAGALGVVCAVVSVGALAVLPPDDPVVVPFPSLESPPATPGVDDLAPPPADGPTVIGAEPATTAAIPLPAGVYVGLVGLASAAIARRRYMKRR